MRIKLVVVLILFFNTLIFSQVTQNENYQFFVNLNNADNHQLMVELITPQTGTEKITYKMPAMVPGTYKVYDFGRFVSDLKAYDKSGNELEVTKGDVNSWDISGANNLYKITYKVRDTFQDTTGKEIFEPVGTSFEKNIFVINNHGLFGYLDGYIRNGYTLNFTKPEGFYGSTSLINTERSDTEEIFTAPDYQFLVDNPIFFDVPDTATINFEETKILISVYSPGKGITAKDMAESNKTLLTAIRTFLGGKLPADRYTFLYYFSNHQESSSFGALEHNYSSLYYMPDVPVQAKSFMLKQLLSTSAHEFYHIVTPLNLHSKEIGEFDFNDPKMSEHLWLYEGTTEYMAGYIQLVEGMMDLKEYAEDIEHKLNGASRYNDTLPFTEMSKGALNEYEPQYNNVYQKGALIGLCMDILIREASGGSQGWQDVINKLLAKYGMKNSFDDAVLFDEIESLTSKSVREFLDKYVAGANRIPYDEIFSKIGIKVESIPYQVADVGGLDMGFNQNTYRLVVMKIDDPENPVMKELGLKTKDEFVSFGGTAINYFNMKDIFGSAKKQMKPGDEIVLVVARIDDSGKEVQKTLKAKIEKTKTSHDYKVSLVEKMTDEQKRLQRSWIQK